MDTGADDHLDLDIAAVLSDAVSERDLVRIWDIYHERRTWQDIIAKNAGADGNADQLVTAHHALAQLPDVTALQALEANARLVDRLVGRRWYVMQDAREERSSWAEIGDALGISRQGAHDFYRRAIETQEKYVEVHDTHRARAALEDDING